MNADGPPQLPGAKLVIITTPAVIDRLVGLLNTGLFGRTLEEAADRVLVRGLEELGHLIGDGEPVVPTRLYQCRDCGHRWLMAFDGQPDPCAEYSATCPKCGELGGEPKGA